MGESGVLLLAVILSATRASAVQDPESIMLLSEVEVMKEEEEGRAKR